MKRKLFQKVKSTYAFSLMLVIIGTLFYACSEEETDRVELIDSGTSTYADIAIVDNHLAFKDKSVFDATVALLVSDQSALNKWEEQFTGYQSMRTAFYSIEATDDNIDLLLDKYKDIVTVTDRLGEQEAVMIIDDRVLATLFNNKGIVQIGTDIYKATYNTFYRVATKDWASLDNDITSISARSSGSDKIEAIHVERQVYEFEVPAINAKKIEDCDSRYDRGRKRVKGEIFTTKIGSLYSAAGARTKHQRKRAWIWWRNRTRQIRLQVTGEFEQYIDSYGVPVSSGPIPIDYDSGWLSDDGRESYTFEFCANVKCKFAIISMYGTHSALCDDNVRRSCNTEVTK